MIQKVQIVNDINKYGTGLSCLVDGKEIKHINELKLRMSRTEFPEIEMRISSLPEVVIDANVVYDFTENNLKNAIIVLKNELLKHGDIYEAFLASIESALIDNGYYGLPFEPEESMARKILDRIIGED